MLAQRRSTAVPTILVLRRSFSGLIQSCCDATAKAVSSTTAASAATATSPAVTASTASATAVGSVAVIVYTVVVVVATIVVAVMALMAVGAFCRRRRWVRKRSRRLRHCRFSKCGRNHERPANCSSNDRHRSSRVVVIHVETFLVRVVVTQTVPVGVCMCRRDHPCQRHSDQTRGPTWVSTNTFGPAGVCEVREVIPRQTSSSLGWLLVSRSHPIVTDAQGS